MSVPISCVRRPHRVAVLSAVAVAAACSAGAPASPSAAPGPAPSGASDAEWRALATPRPAPVAGAPRITLGDFEILGQTSWPMPAGLDAPLALQELVAAGLLRRQDVQFVERRRFTAADEAERRQLPRPAGAPAAGISAGPELVISAAWSPVLGTGRLDVRLIDAERGDIVVTHHSTTPTDADPTSLARAIVADVLAALEEVGRRPQWTDPVPAAAPSTYQASGIAPGAVASFLRGLAAEERWNWEGARSGYQAALAQGAVDFVEARAALARTARLRNGGTLGAG